MCLSAEQFVVIFEMQANLLLYYTNPSCITRSAAICDSQEGKAGGEMSFRINYSLGVFVFRYFRDQGKRLKRYSLVLLTGAACGLSSASRSLSTQHDQIMPPEQRSSGLPPPKTHEMDRPHSNLWPRKRHDCGITAKTEISLELGEGGYQRGIGKESGQIAREN